MNTPLLEVRDLRVAYGTVIAVDGVSFAVEPGEILGIAGESGSGKSTVAHAVARTLPPPARITSGQVLLSGRDLLDLDFEQMQAVRFAELAIVFQSAMNALNPLLRVEDQIADVLRAHSNPTRAAVSARVRELLTWVGVEPVHARSYAHELSGGMRQRIVIAMALALEPRLLLMDEPTTALDVIVQKAILERLLELKRELGFAIVFITHDLELLFEFADRLLILYAGRIAELGSAKELQTAPRHPYTRALIDSTPKLTGPISELSAISGVPPRPGALPPGCAFHPRCPNKVDRCTTQEPHLETSNDGRLFSCHRPL